MRVKADNVDALFERSALALFDHLVGLDTIEAKSTRKLEVSASAIDELMVSWLGELVYLFDSEGWLFNDFQLQLNNNTIVATGSGEHFDSEKHEIQYYIKAVTYHMLTVKKENARWSATVIFDI